MTGAASIRATINVFMLLKRSPPACRFASYHVRLRRIGHRQDLAAGAERADVAWRAAIDDELAQNAADDRRELERVARADRKRNVRMFGHAVDHKFAIRGQRVETRLD